MRKTEDDGVYPSPLNVKAIRIDRIVPDERRPLRSFPPDALADLGRSLRAHGQLVPILVQYLSDEDIFILIDGERRWHAAQQVGLQTLDAIILGRLTPEQRYEWQLLCTLHQGTWQANERMQALHTYMALKGLTSWAQVADRLGISLTTLDAMFHEDQRVAASADRPIADVDAMSQASAAIHLLEQALSRLQPGDGDPADIARMLNDLEDCLTEHRARLVHSQTREVPEEKGKPVHSMPAWGQG